MSRKPPPVTQADRVLLSRAFLALAEQREEIQAELAQQGFDRPGAIAREAMLAFAEHVPGSGRQALLDYWREEAKEWLSALDSPINILKGEYVAPYGYRSELIARLRSQAHLLPTNGEGSSQQIEPAVKAWTETHGPEKKQLIQAANEAMRELAAASGEAARPEFAALDWHARVQCQRERYARTLAVDGFSLMSPSRSFTHFRRRALGGKYVFSLLDDAKSELASGTLRPSFAITWPGTPINSAGLFPIRLAEFDFEWLAPEFRWSCSFERDSWPEFCVAVDTVAVLATIVYRRLDAALQRLQE